MRGVRARPTMTAMSIRRPRENSMSLIQVKVLEGVFTAPQKREIVERLTDAMVAIEGENVRRLTWCIVEEVAGDAWGMGGKTLVADDFRALARADAGAGQT
jgi:4-oxalocrotonate tautomerase